MILKSLLMKRNPGGYVGALVLLCALLSMLSCTKGSKVLSMKNQGAESVDVNTTTGEDGATIGTISKNATAAQRMSAGAGSGIEGAQVLFPAGSLVIDARVTMAQGSSNANDAFAAALGLGSGFAGAGNAVVLSSTPPTDAINPMQLVLPPPSSSKLSLNGSDDQTWAVLYESLKVGENGTYYSGIIPRSEFTVKDGKVVVLAKHFGTYQVVIPKVEVKAKIELPGRAADLAANAKVQKPSLSAIKYFRSQPANASISGASGKLGEKFKEYRYTLDGATPACDGSSIASAADPTPIPLPFSTGVNQFTVKAITCTQAAEASEVAEQIYIYDDTSPIVLIARSDISKNKVINGESITYLISFSEQVVANLKPEKVNIIGLPGGVVTPSVEIKNPTSQNPEVVLSNFTFDAPSGITIRILPDSVVDFAGNVNATSGDSEVVVVAALRPVVAFSSISPGILASGIYVGNLDKPTVKGTLSETDATVSIYLTSTCNGVSAGHNTGSNFSSSGISLTSPVSANAITSIFAKATDIDGNFSDCTMLTDYRWDNSSPKVFKVIANPVTAVRKVGESIDIFVEFDEDIILTEGLSATLSLKMGQSSAAIANYVGIDGTKRLKFSYAVSAGHNSVDLNYDLPTSLVVLNGSIKDAAGNSAILTLPDLASNNSLAGTSNIEVDTVAPVVNGVEGLTANGLYSGGQMIEIKVKFSENVKVIGTPQLELNTSPTQKANYDRGDGSSELVFKYVVFSGDTSSDLDYKLTTSLLLNGGTISDAAGNSATRSLGEPGATGSLGSFSDIKIDAKSPTIGAFTGSTNVSSSGFTLNWTAGLDDSGVFGTPVGSLKYYVCSGASLGEIDTVEECLSKTRELNWTTNALQLTKTGLSANATYHFNVLVQDQSGNRSPYFGFSQSTAVGSPPIMGDLSSSHERKVVFDGTTYWAFWRGIGGIGYGSSDPSGSVISNIGLVSGSNASIQFSVAGKSVGSNYYIALAFQSGGVIKTVIGKINGSSISWLYSTDALSPSGNQKFFSSAVEILDSSKILIASFLNDKGGFVPVMTESLLEISVTDGQGFTSYSSYPSEFTSSLGALSIVKRGTGYALLTASADGALSGFDSVLNQKMALQSPKSEFQLFAGRAGVSYRGSESMAKVNVTRVIKGELYVGGLFDSIGGVAAKNIAKWNGWRWLPLGTGVEGEVKDLVFYQGKIYVGSVEGGIAKVTSWDGQSAWSTLGATESGSPNISALTVYENKLYIGGTFSQFNGSNISNLAIWDGSSSSLANAGIDGPVSSLHVSSTGVLFAAGIFPSNAKIKKFSNGNWEQVGGTVVGEVNVVVSDNEYLYLGGSLSNIGGISVQKIAKMNLSTSTWSSLAFPDTTAIIYRMLLAPDGLYVGGNFPGGVKKYNAGLWNNLGLGIDGKSFGLTFFNGSVVVGGQFTIARNNISTDDVYSRGIAKFEQGKWVHLGHGFNNQVKKIFTTSGNQLVAWVPTGSMGPTSLAGVTSSAGLFIYDSQLPQPRWTGLDLPIGFDGTIEDVTTDGENIYLANSTLLGTRVYKATLAGAWSQSSLLSVTGISLIYVWGGYVYVSDASGTLNFSLFTRIYG